MAEKKEKEPIFNKQAFKERMKDARDEVKQGTKEFGADIKAGAKSAGASIKEAGVATKQGVQSGANKTEKWTSDKLGKASEGLDKHASKQTKQDEKGNPPE